jgi:hypothetical protein
LASPKSSSVFCPVPVARSACPASSAKAKVLHLFFFTPPSFVLYLWDVFALSYEAMEMCLAGTPITAAEAEKFGLVSKVVAAEQLMEVALKMATTIANYSRVLPPMMNTLF